MKKICYAAIIGGGASGLVCALRAAQHHPDKQIIVIERADRIGKKLLVTGNGRCNLTNLNASPDHYHGEGAEELVKILFEKYSPRDVLNYFSSLGLLTRTESDGRVYPLSNQASSVLDVLRMAIAAAGIEVMTSCEITDIRHTEHGYTLRCRDDRIQCDKLVIASGGAADYAGRDSGSKDLLYMLSLPVAALSPALSPVRVRSDVIGMLKGIRAHGKVTLIQHGKPVREAYGEIQFADGALSGICVFDLSRLANREDGCEIAVSLLPDLSKGQIHAELRARRDRLHGECAILMTGVFHKNIALALLKQSGIKPSADLHTLSDDDLMRLSETIHDWRFACFRRRDFSSAQVTAGGVRLSEIDPHTFHSRRIPDLYIVGEALDVDGDCGGYNLQFAFASGMCAGDRL